MAEQSTPVSAESDPAAEHPLLRAIRARFPEAVAATHCHRGDATAIVQRDAIVDVCTWLRDDPEMKFEMLIDLTGVDYLGRRPRFECVYHLLSIEKNHRLRLKVPVEEADPSLPSVVSVWVGANWLEREAWDLYGFKFVGHPDLRRIYLYEEFVGHPLRKDYPKEKRQPLVGPGAPGERS